MMVGYSLDKVWSHQPGVLVGCGGCCNHHDDDGGGGGGGGGDGSGGLEILFSS